MMIKKGVKIGGLKPEMLVALMIVEPILNSYGQELVLTSGSEAKHSRRSRHYIGYALDIRSRDIDPNLIVEVVTKLRKASGVEFYIAYETNHIHIQFDGSPHGS